MPDSEEAEKEKRRELRRERIRKVGEGLKRVGGGISRSPYSALEKLTSGAGFLKSILKWLVTWGVVFGLVALIAAGAIFAVRCTQTGTCGVVLSSIFGGLEKVGAARATEEQALTIFDYFWNPQKIAESMMVSWEKKTVEEEKFGVKIVSFEIEESLYYSTEDPISAIATMNVKAPKDESIEIDFSKACKLDGYDKEIKVSGPFTDAGGKKITVPAEGEDDFDVTCKFLDGFMETELKVDLSRKKVTFKPSYNFKQDVNWYVKSKVDEPVADEKTGATMAIKKGPMILKLYSQSKQPFYEDRPYKLFFELENNKIVWGGRLDEIKDIKLKLPSDVELITKEFCDFEEDNEEESGGNYKTYKLNKIKSDRINIKCDVPGFLLKYDLTGEECISLLKDNIRTSCEFKFLKAEDEISVGLPFMAEVEYTYIAEDIAFANIRRMGGFGDSGEEETDEDEGDKEEESA